jgi:hypothetical protein
VLGFLQRHVRTYAWAKVAFADRPRTYLLHDLPHYDGDAFAHADRQLAALRALADSAGLQLDLVLIPYEPQLRADAPPSTSSLSAGSRRLLPDTASPSTTPPTRSA